MSEPQIPGSLRGMPAEGNPAHPLLNERAGYNEGPTPNMAPYSYSGNPTVNLAVPQQRDYRMNGEWRQR